MAVLFTNLSWWAWSGKVPESSLVSTSPSLSSLETLKISSAKPPTTQERRIRRKWNSREERRTRRIDKEYDLVLVPSDGGCCLSGSESDDSDWSIGWNEPLAPDFHTQVDIDNSFAVLVPCYGRKQLLDASTIVGYSSESNGFLGQWLASLQNG